MKTIIKKIELQLVQEQTLKLPANACLMHVNTVNYKQMIGPDDIKIFGWYETSPSCVANKQGWKDLTVYIYRSETEFDDDNLRYIGTILIDNFARHIYTD